MPQPTRRQLMTQLAIVRHRLSKFRIRDAADYAESLIAEAIAGERIASRVNRGFDVQSGTFGRIEVKCRQLPLDGRSEERVELGSTKANGFDYLAVVIFHADFAVKGAVLVPYLSVWPLIDKRAHRRLRFVEAASLAGAIDITDKVIAASER